LLAKIGTLIGENCNVALLFTIIGKTKLHENKTRPFSVHFDIIL